MKNKLSWNEWWEQVVKLHSQPTTTYDGMVIMAGLPPKGAKKEVTTPTQQQIDDFRNDQRWQKIYRHFYDNGQSPEDAFYDMW